MKKTLLLLLSLILVISSVSVASAEVIMLPDFTTTKEGEITDYHGEEWVVVPDAVNGTPVKKIGDKAFLIWILKMCTFPKD